MSIKTSTKIKMDLLRTAAQQWILRCSLKRCINIKNETKCVSFTLILNLLIIQSTEISYLMKSDRNKYLIMMNQYFYKTCIIWYSMNARMNDITCKKEFHKEHAFHQYYSIFTWTLLCNVYKISLNKNGSRKYMLMI